MRKLITLLVALGALALPSAASAHGGGRPHAGHHGGHGTMPGGCGGGSHEQSGGGETGGGETGGGETGGGETGGGETGGGETGGGEPT